jgi:hypothetical protein
MRFRTSLLAAPAGLAMIAATIGAHAGALDYAFEPVAIDVRNGPGAELAVKLVHKPTGKAVPGAVLFRTRLDMAPDDMASMTAKHEATPSSEPGVYRFKADLTMAGGWAFRIMAKVPGEPETVQGTVVFRAKD